MTGYEMREIRQRLGLSKVNLANLLQFTGKWETVRRKIRRMESGQENIGAVTESILRDLDENGLPERPGVLAKDAS